jgi:hypothetical protein
MDYEKVLRLMLSPVGSNQPGSSTFMPAVTNYAPGKPSDLYARLRTMSWKADTATERRLARSAADGLTRGATR